VIHLGITLDSGVMVSHSRNTETAQDQGDHHMTAATRTRRNTLRTAVTTSRALGYRTLSGIIAAHVENGRLITVGAFLDRIGGNDLPDGKRSWFGRHAKAAHIAATGTAPVRVWAQHRTTGRWNHVCAYGPIDQALYEATASYKGTRHLLASNSTEAA
jgi:hypothetical protein